MKQRVFCLLLALALAVGLLPLTALAAGEMHPVKLTGTSSDFLSGYYVTYEINGIAYRSDQVGANVNRLAWNGMSDGDRRTLLYVYAFAPDQRIAQFGDAGSKEMTDYINEKQGWTALWAAYADRIEQQQCGPLVQYFSDENYDAVLSQLQATADSGPDSWYQRLMYYNEYPEAQQIRQEYEALAGLMTTGRSAYRCIVNAYTKARQASVRAISKELISIIVDKALTPNITVAPTAATTGIYTGISDLFFAVTGYSDELTQRIVGKTQGGMDAVEVINAMRELAQRNYQLAHRCYTEAKALSERIPSDAEAALRVCEAKRQSEEMERAKEAVALRLEAEAQARQEAEHAEKLQSLYDQISGTVPTWNPAQGLSAQEYQNAFAAYSSRVQSYLTGRQSRFNSQYRQLASDFLAWYSRYKSALETLVEQYVTEFPSAYPYQPTEPGWVYYSYVDFTNEELSDYERSCAQYEEELHNYAVNRMQFTEAARSLLDEAVAEFKVLQSRNQALSETSYWTYVSEIRSDGSVLRTETAHFHSGSWDLFYAEGDDGVLRDQSQPMLNALTAAADDWSEARSEGIDTLIQTVEDMKAELIRLRRERLDYVRQRILDYNSVKDNFDLAVQFGEQMRDKQDELLAGLPDWLRELKGHLVDSHTTEGVTYYYVSYVPYYTDVANASPKLAALLNGAANPLSKARALGRELSAKWDEFNRLQRCIDNASRAVEYYRNDMNNITYSVELYKYSGKEDAYGLPRLQSWGDDYAAFTRYINRARTYEEAHNQAALQLLTADLSGCGKEHAAISLLYEELKQTKSTIVRRLQSADENERRAILSELRDMRTIKLYGSFQRNSFYGYARHQAFLNGKEDCLYGTGDSYGQCLKLLDWLEEQYAAYVVPNGVTKGGGTPLNRQGDALLTDDGAGGVDLVLAGAGDRGQLLAEVTPANATERGIVWETLDPELASVDGNGVVTALAEGDARILARALDAPAEPVHANPEDESSEIIGFRYDETCAATFTVRIGAADWSPAGGEGALRWRNLGSDEAPRYTRVTKAAGVTTVRAVFRGDADYGVLCMALYDASGRLLTCATQVNDGTTDTLSASTVETPARVRIFVLDYGLNPRSAPPVDETL